MATLGRSLRKEPRNEPRNEPPSKRLWLVVGALVGWLLVIVVGAGPSVDDSLLGVDGLGDVWAAVYVIVAVIALLLFILFNPFTTTFTPPEKRPRRWGGVVAFLVLVVLMWKPDLLDFLRQRLGDLGSEGQAPEAAPAPPTIDVPSQNIDRDPVAQATDVLILAAALAAVVLLWWFVRNRMAPEAEFVDSADDGMTESELAGAVDDARVALDTEGDPRLGVLKAYAVLEQTLADQGSRRTLTETPREHLARSLPNLTIDTTPLLQLADLYEMARFSERPMFAAHRDEAARLLSTAQHALLTSQVH